METKVAVVTGSNKGIGLAIVRGLCKAFNGEVILTARDESRGKAAVAELEKEGLHPKFHQLDITHHSSTERLRDFLKANYGGLDVLVNNAGIMSNPNAPLSEQAEVVNKTNYFANLDACEVLYPLLRPHARVCNVSGGLAMPALAKCSDAIKARFTSEDITIEELNVLINKFIQSAQNNTHLQEGFADSAYGISKIAVIVMSMIHQREMDKKGADDIIINACCPGYTDTDMTNGKGTQTVDEAADTPVYLALLPPGAKEPRGLFLRKRQVWEFKA